MNPTESKMPMGRVAAKYASGDTELPPLPIGPPPEPMPMSPAPDAAAPMPATPPPPAGAPQSTGPQPGGPTAAPQSPNFIKYKQQADGSLAAMIDGAALGLPDDVFIQRYDPPKIPRAFQPAANPAPGQPPTA